MHDDHDHDHGTDESGNPWPDRVNEAYYNKMGEAFGARTRDRINWMAAQAAGATALDVGCSQGITSLLMAREGLRVLGIDIDPATLHYAEGERAKEIPSVRERLEFRCCELAALGDERFDTVVLGEVIEHQTNAVRFIRQAATHVAPGGRLVVTVPFGLHPWPDHKCTVFPADVVEAIRESFALSMLDVVDGYVRLVAERRDAAAIDPAVVIAATQKGTIEWQGRYFEASRREQESAKAHAAAEKQLRATREALQTATAAIQTHQNAEHAVRVELDGVRAQAEAAAKAASAALAQADAHLRARVILHEADRAELHKRDALLEQRATLLEQRDKLLAERDRALEHRDLALDQARREHAEAVKAHASDTQAWQRKEARFEREMERLAKAEADVVALRKAEQALRAKLETMARELGLAQAKRSGHYQHLVAERERGARLVELAQQLHEDNERYRQSIALALGQALLGARTPRGLLRLPRALAGLARRWRRRERDGVAIEPLLLPQLRAVVLDKTNVPAPGKEGGGPASSDAARANVNALSIIGWRDDVPAGALPVMSVMDEFSRACFAPQASLIEPRPDNWEALIDATRPRLLLVESCWKGNHGTWQYRIANYANPPGRELPMLVDACRARGIPTVFWNKEDPVHFDNFIDNAVRFDGILTTAAEAVPRYQDRTSARVGVLQFAAEESLHNPIGSAQRNGKVCFAGSYYANRFEDRRNDQRMLLEAASRFDFDIFDRNHDPKAATPSDFAFPGDLARFVRGRLPYAEMGKAYRAYSVFLNVNSVIDSPTMFSRRVFELLACGTPVVSTWSRGTEDTFGTDLVWHVHDREEAEHAIGTLLSDAREWRRRSLAGIRAVMAAHTFRHRFAELLAFAGVDDTRPDPLDSVLAVARVGDQREADAIVQAFARQKMAGSVRKQLLLVPQGHAGITADVEGVRIAEGAGDDLAALVRRAGGTGAVAVLSPGAVYGAHYLQDLLHAARYSGAAVVGKPLSGTREGEYAFDVALHPHSLLFAPGVATAAGGDALLRGDLASALGQHRTFAADAANFQQAQDGADLAARDALLRTIEL